MTPLPPTGPVPAIVRPPVQFAQPGDWERFLAEVKAAPVDASLPDPAHLAHKETLPADRQAPLKRAVLVVPAGLDAGSRLAVEDLARFLEKVTGQVPQRVAPGPDGAVTLPATAAGATVIALGQGRPTPGLGPVVGPAAQSFALRATEATVGGRRVPVVGVTGSDALGLAYGVSRLMELGGARFYSYADTFTPAQGEAVVPANGYTENFSPDPGMKIRGFAPHFYHPIPLSIAFHTPSPEHLAMLKRYVDWCVETGQNHLDLPLLELDQRNRYLPLGAGHANYDAWTPHAKALVDYAHQRGLKVAVNVGFASYASSNVYAVNPFKAILQTVRLALARRGLPAKQARVKTLEARVAAAERKPGGRPMPEQTRERNAAVAALATARTARDRQEAHYQALLSSAARTDRRDIGKLVDKLMVVPWDEISWNMGTSEFTPTNDDLTIGWMNDAAAILKNRHPGVKTSISSHAPSKPVSKKYQESYYNLVRFADPAVGAMVHTTAAYTLTDKAPVYGNEDYTHKLKLLTQATPEREDVFYPETSYWVAHDVSVPLFLPVYMLNRKRDVDTLKRLPNVDGQITFTTGWEWGYWLNDYAVARMQAHPEESLSEILDGALAPLGPARTPMVQLLSDCMRFQQHWLLEKGLIRHLQGFDSLTDFGVTAAESPVLSKLLEGTNSTPIRLKPEKLMKMDAKALEAFERGELADLGTVSREFTKQATAARALGAQVPAGGKPYHDELADSLEVNALRAREVHAALSAVVFARKAELTRDPALRRAAEAQLAVARGCVDEAIAHVRDREQDYREAPSYTYEKSQAKTIWSGRYLTPVHDLTYWRNTYDEVAGLLGQAKYPAPEA